MNLAEMIGYIQRDVYCVVFALNAMGTQVHWSVTCDHVTDAKQQEMAAQNEEMLQLFHMTMMHDVRLCPTPDDHRATYAYNRKHACFCCEACGVARREQLAKAKEESAALGYTIPSEFTLIY